MYYIISNQIEYLKEGRVLLEALKKMREDRNLSQQEMAEIIGLNSKNSYSMKERGERKFSLHESKLIADYFGTTIEAIFFR